MLPKLKEKKRIIEYADISEKDFVRSPLWYHEKGLMQTATGYGYKLSTIYKVKHDNRWKRVYCSCHSNIGSLYIIYNKRPLYIR